MKLIMSLFSFYSIVRMPNPLTMNFTKNWPFSLLTVKLWYSLISPLQMHIHFCISRLNRSAKYFLEKDLQGKFQAGKIDDFCSILTSTSSKLEGNAGFLDTSLARYTQASSAKLTPLFVVILWHCTQLASRGQSRSNVKCAGQISEYIYKRCSVVKPTHLEMVAIYLNVYYYFIVPKNMVFYMVFDVLSVVTQWHQTSGRHSLTLTSARQKKRGSTQCLCGP